MKALLMSLCLLFCLSLTAQNDSHYLISLEKGSNMEIESDFYINNIYDGRQFREDIGIAQISIANSKVQVIFKNPFVDELASFLAVLYPKKQAKKPISIRVNEFFVSEVTTSNRETGYATVVLDIIDRKENRDYIIGTYTSTISEVGFDVTAKHDDHLILAIKNCFDDYKKSNETYKIPVEFDCRAALDSTKNFDVSKKGVYVNYKDLNTGKVLDLDDYRITKYNEGNCLLNNRSGRVETKFFGFSDGLSFYINSSRFSTVRFYFKTEIMGDYYFINEVRCNTVDFSVIRSSFGLLGMLLTPDSSELSVPLLLDRVTGSPIFLTNKYIINMLSSDKELLKEYRKTERTVVDKKRIDKKYFNVM
jgi:hypothetical protein